MQKTDQKERSKHSVALHEILTLGERKVRDGCQPASKTDPGSRRELNCRPST
jgi:hypothetical protein